MLWELCTSSLPVFPLDDHWPPKDNKEKEVKGEMLDLLAVIREHCLVEEKNRWTVDQLVQPLQTIGIVIEKEPPPSPVTTIPLPPPFMLKVKTKDGETYEEIFFSEKTSSFEALVAEVCKLLPQMEVRTVQSI